MKQSVRTAKIDKRTEVCYILNNAFYHIAFLNPLKQFLLPDRFFSDHKLFSVADITPSSGIIFRYDKLDLLSSILI